MEAPVRSTTDRRWRRRKRAWRRGRRQHHEGAWGATAATAAARGTDWGRGSCVDAGFGGTDASGGGDREKKRTWAKPVQKTGEGRGAASCGVVGYPILFSTRGTI
jgi:hypothetical protein